MIKVIMKFDGFKIKELNSEIEVLMPCRVNLGDKISVEDFIDDVKFESPEWNKLNDMDFEVDMIAFGMNGVQVEQMVWFKVA